MMVAEIVGGLTFGSIALVADEMHMSTHAGALLLAALATTRGSTPPMSGSPSAQASLAISRVSHLQSSSR